MKLGSKVTDNVFRLILSLNIVLFIVVYFALPKSLLLDYRGSYQEVGDHLSIWFKQRFLLLSICIIISAVLIYLKGLTKSQTILIISMGLVSTIQVSHGFYFGIYPMIGATTAFLLCNYRNAVLPWVRSASIFFILLYPIQYLFFSIHDRPTASFLDANISGYYLFLTYLICRHLDKSYLTSFMAIIVFTLGLLSLSRNFILAVLIYEFLHLLCVKTFLKKYIVAYALPWLVTLLSIFCLLIFSIFYTGKYINAESSGGDKSRLYQLVDSSNYLRFKANLDYVSNLNAGHYLLIGNGSEMDERVSHRPHNAFFRAGYRYGAIIGVLSIVAYIMVSSFIFKDSPIYVLSLFSYYVLLNDFITGNELVLFTIIGLFMKPQLSVQSSTEQSTY